MPLDEVKGRPLAGNQGSGLNAISVTNANTTAILTGPAVSTRHSGALRAAALAVYQPCGRRQWWVGVYSCPWCDGEHLSRGETEDAVTGPRRSGCGRLVDVGPTP